MEKILQLIADRENDYPNALLEAQKRLLEHLDLNPDDGAAMTLLAEARYWLGTLCEEDGRKEAILAEGVAIGKQAAAVAPDSVAANFWYANCMAAHGMVRGMMNSLFYLKPMEKHGNRALELDESFFNAAPLRMMGRFYCKVPPWPVGSGDKKKGLALAKRAVELAPDHLYNQVILAEAYLSARYFDEAREGFESVLAAPQPEAFKLSHAKYRAEAAFLLERLENMI
ncbi:MAG: TRAP transporter TatT component family protein [Xanthomonadales bacterium]|nr:TRAP transporter TatT component family protein [Xanthomonadales bacterium]